MKTGTQGYRRMSKSRKSGQQLDEEEPFIFRWCEKYGLSDGSAAILMAEGFNSAAELLAITSEDIKELPLSMGQKLLFRGALLQFKEGDVLYAQRRARKYKIPVENALFMSKQSLIELSQSRNREEGGGPPKEKLSQQEIDERLELRRRIRRKKNKGQGKVSGQPKLTLAERIQNQRQNLLSSQSSAMSGSKCSLASESSSASYGTVRTEPIGHVTSIRHTDQRYIRSAMDVPHNARQERNREDQKMEDDIDKEIEDILADEPKLEKRSSSVAKSTEGQSRSPTKQDIDNERVSTMKSNSTCYQGGRSGQKDVTNNDITHEKLEGQRLSIGQQSQPVSLTKPSNKSGQDHKKNEKADAIKDHVDNADLITRMDREVDSLLRELSADHKLRKSTKARGDLKRANEILDKELLTEEERKMVGKFN